MLGVTKGQSCQFQVRRDDLVRCLQEEEGMVCESVRQYLQFHWVEKIPRRRPEQKCIIELCRNELHIMQENEQNEKDGTRDNCVRAGLRELTL